MSNQVETLKYRIAVFKLCVIAVLVPWMLYEMHLANRSSEVRSQCNKLYQQANEATDRKDFKETDRLLKQANELAEKEWGK